MITQESYNCKQLLTKIILKKQFFLSYILYIYVRDNKEREKKMLQTTAESNNNTSGNGQFGSLVRKRRNKRNNSGEFNIENYNYLGLKDRRMRFNNARDPIYYVFDVIENRPIKTLAKEFVKDSFFEIANFVTKVVR